MNNFPPGQQSPELQPLEIVALMDRVIAVKPDDADAHILRGNALIELGRFQDAIASYDKAITLKPDHVQAWSNRGVALKKLSRLEDAVASYDRAIALQPNGALGHSNRGNALIELGRLDEALASLDKAVALKPDYADAWYNRGIALKGMGRPEDAVASYDRAIAFKPDYAEAHSNRGAALMDLRRAEEALASYDRAVAIKPDYAEAWTNRGVALKSLNRAQDAIADHDKAIAIRPDYAEAWCNRGVALNEMGQADAAAASYDKAIALNPGFAEAHYNRGVVLNNLAKTEDAIASYDRAIALKPEYAEAYSNRGVTLVDSQRLEEALASYDRAIAIKPNYAEANFNKSLTLLLTGEFDPGWALHEWRLKLDRPVADLSQFSWPHWRGEESLVGKTILLHAEQGLGDTIQFCRYATLAHQLGAKVLLEIPKPLAGLMRGLEGVATVIEQGEARPAFDYHSPLMSLPQAFKTTLSTVPHATPYLHADEAKTRSWQNRVGDGKKLKVGLVWSGGLRPEHSDHAAALKRRNIPLEFFSRSLNAIDADFFSLQKGLQAEAEIRARRQELWPHGNFHDFTDEIADFSDTAALIANLDIVVSVDTSTAHLAGALGKPTWILNRFNTCWRWLLHRDDSPWYPSVKLYRQAEDRSWDPVLQRVAADLTNLASRASF